MLFTFSHWHDMLANNSSGVPYKSHIGWSGISSIFIDISRLKPIMSIPPISCEQR